MYTISVRDHIVNLMGPEPMLISDAAYIEEQKMKGWCKERVGPNSWNYYGKYRKTPYVFKFKREPDLLAFKLTFAI